MAGRSYGGEGRTWGAFEQSGTASEAQGPFSRMRGARCLARLCGVRDHLLTPHPPGGLESRDNNGPASRRDVLHTPTRDKVSATPTEVRAVIFAKITLHSFSDAKTTKFS
eukprot:3891021-Prymnesium_polylepis.1